MVVKVLINTTAKSLNKVYDYIVPDDLAEDIELGKRVEVSFGRSKDTEGIIVKVDKDDLGDNREFKLKAITAILDEVSYIDEKKLKLAKYISHIYFCNVYDALKLMLPPGTSSKKASKSINTKQETKVIILKTKEEIEKEIEENTLKSAKQIYALRFLMENENVSLKDITDGLNISRAVIKTLEKNGYVMLKKFTPETDLLNTLNIEKSIAKIPTEEQKNAINKISGYIDEEKYLQCLLFGVTGSGKTEVYLQVLQNVLKKGKKAIILVPEISLTFQTVSRFVSRFGNNVAVLHSKMTVSKRKEEYKRIKEGKVDIVIGARSAIFAPIDNLGMVIIDEEHDSSYYSQSTPKYSTKEVASYICKENNALLLLGSATPEVTTYYNAKNGNIKLIEMTKRAGNAKLPSIELVDLREDKLNGNTSFISSRLKEEILKNIQNNEQTMLFLNRRGYSSYLTCKDCSFIFKCPNCDVALNYHKNSDLLHCHYCSYVERNVEICPKCGSKNLSSGSVGTQKVEEELNQIYPGIKTLRMDADSTVSKGAHEKILNSFKEGNVDVLIGTQMISKGHDIANVSLVGILGADSMIAMNDYMASEKAFSNIMQVSGRAGRAEKEGRVLIQTADTTNYILQSVKNHSYLDFYNNEIEFRNRCLYPPFVDIFLFEFTSVNIADVKKEATMLYDILNKENSGIYKVSTPRTPLIQKINNKYRINILMKTKASSKLYNLIYEKLNIYNKKRNKKVNMTITKNPLFIN